MTYFAAMAASSPEHLARGVCSLCDKHLDECDLKTLSCSHVVCLSCLKNVTKQTGDMLEVVMPTNDVYIEEKNVDSSKNSERLEEQSISSDKERSEDKEGKQTAQYMCPICRPLKIVSIESVSSFQEIANTNLLKVMNRSVTQECLPSDDSQEQPSEDSQTQPSNASDSQTNETNISQPVEEYRNLSLLKHSTPSEDSQTQATYSTPSEFDQTQATYSTTYSSEVSQIQERSFTDDGEMYLSESAPIKASSDSQAQASNGLCEEVLELVTRQELEQRELPRASPAGFSENTLAETGDAISQENTLAETGDDISQENTMAAKGDAISQENTLAETGDAISQEVIRQVNKHITKMEAVLTQRFDEALRQELMKLREMHSILKSDLTALQDKNSKLTGDSTSLVASVTALQEETSKNSTLVKSGISDLTSKIQQLGTRLRQAEESTELKTAITDLAGQLQTVTKRLIVTEKSTEMKKDIGDLMAYVRSISGRLQNVEKTIKTTVAFHARVIKQNTPAGAKRIVINDDVIFNLGRGYNAETGIFTAPVTGIYLFIATASVGVNEGRVHFYIKVDDKDVAEGYSKICEGGSDCTCTVHTVTSVNAGQTVYMSAEKSCTFCFYYTHFTGTLLHQDL